MSLACIGTSGRKESATLVSLFSIHVSKPYKWKKIASVIENYTKLEIHLLVNILQAEKVSESRIPPRLVGVCIQKVFSWKELELSTWCNNIKDGKMSLNEDPEKHKGKLGTSHTNENHAIVKGEIKESKFTKLLKWQLL
jgi:hypothetical protein